MNIKERFTVKILRFTAFAVSMCFLLTGSVTLSHAAEKSYAFCDVDGDGALTASDARQVLRYVVDLDAYTKGHLKVCGVKTKKFSSLDARYVLRLCVGLEESEINSVKATDKSFTKYVNFKPEPDFMSVKAPGEPEIKAKSGTFTFTVYGKGHGAGLSQYGAVALEKHGYTYKQIIKHYFTGVEIRFIEEFPAEVIYPTFIIPEGKTEEEGEWQFIPRPTEEILVRMVYQEIYGITAGGDYEETLKAMTVCIFSNLARYNFNVESRWNVGLAYEGDYEEIPENLKTAVRKVMGQYITEKGKKDPVFAVYGSTAAGYTASSQDIWETDYPYLMSVPSHFDMETPGFVQQYTYTAAQMKELIKAYDSTIKLSKDPAKWLKILEHTASIDENRGYVTKIRVGDRELSGYSDFQFNLMENAFVSSCFTVHYTP